MSNIELVQDQIFTHQLDALNKLTTPCYVYSPQKLISNFLALKEKLQTNVIMSIKANPCPDLLLRTSHVLRDGYEIATLNELKLVPGKGTCTKFINNPAMTEPLMRAGLRSKCEFVIDCLPQLKKMLQLPESKALKSIIVRLNCSIVDYILNQSSKVYDHFGCDWNELIALLKFASEKNIKIKGLHIFNGSYSFPKRAFDTASAMQTLLPIVEKKLGYNLEFLNLGGGFPADFHNDPHFDFAAYCKQLRNFPESLQLAHEAGRGIFTSCGQFITRVISKKIINETIYLICDGGMAQNFLLCKTESRMPRFQEPKIVFNSDNTDISRLPQVFVGSSCNKADIIGKLPENVQEPQINDYCIFDNCGAYNHTYTVSDFLGLDKAQVYLES